MKLPKMFGAGISTEARAEDMPTGILALRPEIEALKSKAEALGLVLVGGVATLCPCDHPSCHGIHAMTVFFGGPERSVRGLFVAGQQRFEAQMAADASRGAKN